MNTSMMSGAVRLRPLQCPANGLCLPAVRESAKYTVNTWLERPLFKLLLPVYESEFYIAAPYLTGGFHRKVG
jgi:hypothetical protein